MTKKSVYIASPYTVGDKMENVERQIRCADTLATLGYLPYWPLSSHFWHMLLPREWEFWMSLDFKWVLKCDCVLRLFGASRGADAEVAWALQHNKPVFHSVEELDAFWKAAG